MKQFLKSTLAVFGYKAFPVGTLALDRRQIRNIPYYRDMYNRIEDIKGNIVECGVGKGRTFLYFSDFAFEEQKDRQVWGFDSFEGFPEPTKEDASSRNPKKGEWSGISPDDIRTILRTAGLSAEFIKNRVTLVKGFVEDTLPQYDGAPIALLHIDLDLYQAYVHALKTLVPFVSKNGVVMFDEYGEANWPGATQAVDEFLKDKAWKLEKHPFSGKRFFVKT